MAKDGHPPTRSVLSVELYDTTQLALEKAIEGAAARQQAIAANLANVDTPGYQRVDVDFHQTLQNAMASGGEGLRGATFSPQRDATAQVRPDGSTVDPDVESATQARNGLEYEALVQISKARIDILQSAMGTK
ncbi:MAG TPA: flagellar basal body protein [Solirubrobacteraceae bacterium]|nr:flagellar basal body protein [Solirubrobacteraceae bacterium]